MADKIIHVEVTKSMQEPTGEVGIRMSDGCLMVVSFFEATAEQVQKLISGIGDMARGSGMLEFTLVTLRLVGTDLWAGVCLLPGEFSIVIPHREITQASDSSVPIEPSIANTGDLRMRRLLSIQPIALEVNEVGSTVRRGSKWADLKPAEQLELAVGPTPDNVQLVGHAEVTQDVWTGRFCDVPARHVEANHCRGGADTYELLLAAMRGAYGEDFSETEAVTAFFYRRID